MVVRGGGRESGGSESGGSESGGTEKRLTEARGGNLGRPIWVGRRMLHRVGACFGWAGASGARFGLGGAKP
eukprot:7376676-Prymnesium_polylepis.1